ncbi:hypothetical protein GPECTOR_12g490 [Gonium pectorale]|uniref:Protein kinase domain-containing protein n=1 Tax=Gonium pectorale TaxID=33097 RepID=A0A150GNX8_GONPE|nr:hypothetical protein GPECTOR_12g490 [Gonium pectorale]|eukprot:KXZ51527.1 hypothetical protein GPECTOR_12g490 [Gonium pectorale]
MVPRPDVVPGPQLTDNVPPFVNCVDSASAPAMRRCWPGLGMYTDTAAFATNLDQYGKVVLAGYILWGLRLYFLCETLMTDQCVATKGGPVGCFYSMFPTGPTPQPPPATALSPVGAAGSPRSRPLLAPLLGGTLGVIRQIRSQDLELVPVTPLTPIPAAIDMDVRVGEGAGEGELQLLPITLGKGAFGRVVVGLYGGQRVAVKLLNTGLALPRAEAAAWVCEAVSVVQQASAGLAAGDSKVAGGVAALAALQPLPRGGAGGAAGNSDDSGGGNGVGGSGGSGPGGGTDVEAEGAAPALQHGGSSEPAGQQAGHGDGNGLSGAEAATLAAGAEQESDSTAQAAGRAFGGEVAVLARCQHPNIVRLLAASLEPSRPCLVMELMDTCLARLLYGGEGGGGGGEGRGVDRDAGRPGTLLSLPKVLHIVLQIGRALSYLHPTVLHRDLKPANVLVSNADSETPVVKLADFGLSRLHDTVLVTRNPEVGTTPYVSPEAFDPVNYTISDRADMYALGVILWELLSGMRPWEGKTDIQVAYAVALAGERLPLSAIPPERCLPKLAALLRDCWDADPKRRPAAAEFVKTIALVQQTLQAQRYDVPTSGVMLEVDLVQVTSSG